MLFFLLKQRIFCYDINGEFIMNELYKLKDKTIYDIDTTILYTSSYNYTDDAIYFINNNCLVITKDRSTDYNDIPNNIYEIFHVEELETKKERTELDELKLKILSNLNSKERTIVFFNCLTYLDNDFKEILIKYLKQKNKRIINYTTEIEETLLLDYLIVFHEGKVIMEGLKELVLKEEKILNKLGFRLPFIVELSIGLKYYGLVNKIYFDKEKLVNDLWK